VIKLIFKKELTVPQVGDRIFLNFPLKHAFIVRGKIPLMIRYPDGTDQAGKIPIRCNPTEAEQVALEAIRSVGGDKLGLESIESLFASFLCFKLVSEEGNHHDG